MKRLARIVLVFARIVLFSITFTVLVFATMSWSIRPKDRDPSRSFSAQFKVGMTEAQVEAVLERYGTPYYLHAAPPEYRVAEGEIEIGSSYGFCSLVLDRDGKVSSVVSCNNDNAFQSATV